MGVGPNVENRGTDRTLDAREFRFVEEYVCGDKLTAGNAYRSAVAAGYAAGTADTHAPGWVRSADNGGTKPWIYEAIQRRREELQTLTAMDRNEVMLEISKLARYNAGKHLKITSNGDPYIDMSEMTMDDLAAIGEVVIEEYKEGRGDDAVDVKRVKVKPWDKRGALDLMSKVLGMQKTVLSNDPENPLPSTNIVNGIRYDLSKLTLAEAKTLQELLNKATAE